MSKLEKVPATIVTGFLGAGKTTLVRHVMAQAAGRRIAIIVNEFGSLGIDGDLLKSCGIPGCEEDNIVELANGCICCTVADDFLPTMTALLDRPEPPEHILIETSGLALPKPLIKAFNWPGIRSRVTVDGVVTVVDGPAVADGRFADDPAAVEAQRAADDNLDHDNPLAEVFEDQLGAADLVVLNKADLLDDAAVTKLRAEIATHLPRQVKVVAAREGALDIAVLLGLGATAEDDLDARPSHHDGADDHEHDDFDSFVVPMPEAASAEALVEKLSKIAGEFDILRMKGFSSLPGKPMRLAVQGVGTRFRHHFDRAWAPGEARDGQLVVIGQAGLDKAAIAAAIAG
ncbi:cobalamin biosynthesis protein CobW [Pseudoroseomonas ludipueritiae]|uniref:Cobalamin biosynthesis protein CobW n=1 Tax=Pseudoroseomonas ludipueritiae TaxID=198093 RepID=A0ABR7RBR0_9PROT|nr:cobalamin biosynthesis protein CobW [Pseudoroseomonas ludipueritiae]